MQGNLITSEIRQIQNQELKKKIEILEKLVKSQNEEVRGLHGLILNKCQISETKRFIDFEEGHADFRLRSAAVSLRFLQRYY